MGETEVIKGLMFLKEKLYNGIFQDRLKCIDLAIAALEEVQKYRQIGTVEECREAVEKQKSKSPTLEGDGYDEDGELCRRMNGWTVMQADEWMDRINDIEDTLEDKARKDCTLRVEKAESFRDGYIAACEEFGRLTRRAIREEIN